MDTAGRRGALLIAGGLVIVGGGLALSDRPAGTLLADGAMVVLTVTLGAALLAVVGTVLLRVAAAVLWWPRPLRAAAALAAVTAGAVGLLATIGAPAAVEGGTLTMDPPGALDRRRIRAVGVGLCLTALALLGWSRGRARDGNDTGG